MTCHHQHKRLPQNCLPAANPLARAIRKARIHLRRTSILGIGCTLLISNASLASPAMMRVSAGTGFFVNKNGHLVTNAHVVKNCESINILTRNGTRPVSLIAEDPTHDLAVLKADDMGGNESAPLRWNISDLKVGDSVALFGFPGQSGANGQPSFKHSTVTSLQGPAGEPVWIQLGSVAQKGNSGGPVLDNAGNVIAVISGIAQTYRIGQAGAIEGNPIGQADIAITLATLREFLHTNAVSFYEAPSGLVAYADPAIQKSAQSFTVPVRCVVETIQN